MAPMPDHTSSIASVATGRRAMVLADAKSVFANARKIAALLCCASIALLAIHTARAESTKFPNRPVQLIVPYAAGGATDAVARLLQQGMEKRLGQPILVVNRPGASTTLGTQQVARAAPDGHTIAMVSVPHVANYTLL